MADLEKRYRCPNGHEVRPELKLDEYPFICDECDENYFLIELTEIDPE